MARDSERIRCLQPGRDRPWRGVLPQHWVCRVAYCWGAIPLDGHVSAVPVRTHASQGSVVYPSFYGACALAAGTAFCWGTEYSTVLGLGNSTPMATKCWCLRQWPDSTTFPS